jgi:flagellar basal-body rod protein FlgF
VSSGIYLATAGAVAQSNALDATANNIANASTTGFQADRITFREAMSGAKSPDTSLVSAGTKRVDTQYGALANTGNPLDLAIEGDGMFAIDTPNGQRFTRAGNFRLDNEGALVTVDGFKVRGEGGPITIPPDTKVIDVGADGSVNADGENIGKLELVKYKYNQLKREGGTMFSATGQPDASTDGAPLVRSGMLESSNVNVVRGVVDLVKVSRTYESLMRVIQGYHDVESRAARDLGGPK